MKVMMDCRGRGAEDGRRKTEDRELPRHASSVICLLSSVLWFTVLLAGCENKALEQAQQEAREAKTTVQQLKHNLGLAEREITNLRAEIKAVQESRDEIQDKIDRTNKERDQALTFAQQAQEAINAQSSGQVSETAALQQQVAEFKALVDEQQKLIDQLQKSAAAGPAAVAPPDQVPPAEPNEELP